MQTEYSPSPEDVRTARRGMLIRLRNYALHHYGQIGLRTLTVLQDLDLLEDQEDPISVTVDLKILEDANHPHRLKLPSGPLLLFLSQDEKPRRRALAIPDLLLSDSLEERKAAFAYLERMIADGSLEVTPKTQHALETARTKIMSDSPHDWRSASIELFDAFMDDFLFAMCIVRQCLAADPVIQDCLNEYAPRVIYPSVSSLDSIPLEVKNPEDEHATLSEIVKSVITEAVNLRDACARYLVRLGYLPLAPGYAMCDVVSGWIESHPGVDVWKEVWDWAAEAHGPLPRYHACCVFVIRPDLIPEGKLADLWREIVGVVRGSIRKNAEAVENEPWTLRQGLARHYACHLEAHRPENQSAGIACLSWWLAERTAALFPDNPKSAGFYRKNWVESATQRSIHVRIVASSRMGRSFLRYVTHTVKSPWATSLLALMGTNLERLAPHDQSNETRLMFHEALISCLGGALPFATDPRAEPTYAMEYPLGLTAVKWAANEPEEYQKVWKQLIETSKSLGSTEGLCVALRDLTARTLVDQMVVTMALKAKAYNDPPAASGIWEILADAEWRTQVLTAVKEPVLGHLIEACGMLQVQNQGKWFSDLPHFIAELCEKEDDEERRCQLFLYAVHTSLASDTVSAVRRLLRGEHKAQFVQIVTNYRESIEASWASYPAWVQGRLRGLLASLRAV